MKTTSILLVATMFAASGMAVAATQDTAKPAAAPTAATSAAASHRHHKAHKASAATASKAAVDKTGDKAEAAKAK